MIKLSLGIGLVVSIILLQLPAESPRLEPTAGPFANWGQVLIAVTVILTNVITLLFTNYMTEKREARKEKRETEKDELALKQRKLDSEEAEQRRKWDMEDRINAREELERRLVDRANEVKYDLNKTRVILEKKVEETVASTKLQDKKLDTITSLVDGKMSKLLQEIADLKQAIAKASGSHDDIASAEAAQKTADEQHARVRDVEGK